ncbi:hypothetical protein CKM354_000173900 [Cercospora kikuchii]|uniref:Uncharacterized protein n=1 Tax=Cercospora kikuchii TaxID=84275 RepID=A0A9P3C6B0_9PEZI|nr:uncharacterized protein CKM354_000173900 [Cercospora kikuchii]GIZ38319.1 hypothetical protein CKM354_000173900 [Cercospora kikuchii]
MSIDSATSSTVENSSTTSTTDVSMFSQTSSSASTISPPVITQCSLTVNNVTVTESGSFYTSRATVCACNGGQTRDPAGSKETDGGKVYWCPNETAGTAGPGAYMPITTIHGKPTSCETFTATTPPGSGHSQSAWTAAVFCTCDHERTLAYYTVTEVNGNVTSGCGAPTIGATLIPVAGSPATHAIDTASQTTTHPTDTASQTATTTSTSPTPTVVFEIYVKLIPKGNDKTPVRKYWAGGAGRFNSSMCDVGPPLAVEQAQFDDAYPQNLTVRIPGQKECYYVDASGQAPGKIACADGYAAGCTPFTIDARIIKCNDKEDDTAFTFTPLFHCLH